MDMLQFTETNDEILRLSNVSNVVDVSEAANGRAVPILRLRNIDKRTNSYLLSS